VEEERSKLSQGNVEDNLGLVAFSDYLSADALQFFI